MAKCPWTLGGCRAKDARVFMPWQDSSNVGAVDWVAPPKKNQDDWLLASLHHPSPKTSCLNLSGPGKGRVCFRWRFLLLEGIGPGLVRPPGISRCYQFHCNQMGFQAHAQHHKCRFGFAGSPFLFPWNREVFRDVGRIDFPKSMDPSQRTPLSQNVTKYTVSQRTSEIIFSPSLKFSR